VRAVHAWLLGAAVAIGGVVIGVSLNAGGRHEQGSGPTTSTTAGSAAVAEFVQLDNDRTRALDAWTQAQSAPFAAFLPVSTKARSEEQHIKEQAGAAARTCGTADEDPCRLLDTLRELADRESFGVGMLQRAKRLGRRAEAHAALTGLRGANCDSAGEVVFLLDRPSSPIWLSHRLPAPRDQA